MYDGLAKVASVTVHTVLGAALLLGTTRLARSTPPTHQEPIIFFPQPAAERRGEGIGAGIPVIGPPPEVPSIPIISTLESGAPGHQSFSTTWTPKGSIANGLPAGSSILFSEAGPEVLAGPLPAYPELLRQAGLEGQVVLEARLDTTGRVRPASIRVVSASHAGFVEPARQALISTLFRPARANGRAVSTLVRVPFTFSIRGGTGRAR